MPAIIKIRKSNPTNTAIIVFRDRACLHKKDRWSAQAAEFATSDMSKQMKVSFEVFFVWLKGNKISEASKKRLANSRRSWCLQ